MVNFDDTKTAFANKSDSQLKKAYWLFKLVASQKLVSFGKWSSALAMKIGIPIKGMVKATVYDQFVGGETIDECEKTIKDLYQYGVHSILDYSVEGAKTEGAFDETMEKTIQTIKYGASHDGVPFAVFKVTGVARFALLQKVSEGKKLSDAESKEFEKAKNRIETICKEAGDQHISILIDAEESWIQPAIDDLALEMMRKLNKDECIVYNTAQMYRWDRLEYIKQIHEIAEKENFYCGLKLVRGAYMEKERERAYEMGYKSPIQPDKESTDKDYDLAVEYIIANHSKLFLMAGSHNEESNRRLTQLMEKHGLEKSSKNVWFSQLYGMSDNLSFVLAKDGYNVVKYLPFGPIEKTLPYLIRRAEENTSAAGQTTRELNLIQKEMKRRGID